MKYPSLNIKATDEELRVFIKSRIQVADFHHLFDDELSAEISETLVNSAQGLFLLPALQLSRVLQEPTRGDIEDVLGDLPRSVFEALRGEMARVLHQSQSRCTLALNTLMWLCMTRDPMSADNLADILSLDMTQKRGSNERYRPSIEVVIECCHGLIQFDKMTITYQLTHLAVREHLLAYETEHFQDTIAKLVAKSCLFYVLDSAFDNGPSFITTDNQNVAGTRSTTGLSKTVEASSIEDDMDEEQVDFIDEHPFLGYFSQNWGCHLNDTLHDTLHELAIHNLVMRFLVSQPRIARVTQVDHFPYGYRYLYWNLQEVWSTSGAILASNFGLKDIVSELLDAQKEQVDYATSIGTTALNVAVSQDQLEFVRELLKRDADPLKQNWYAMHYIVLRRATHCRR